MSTNQLKRLLIGSPLRTKQLSHEKLPKWKALAVFSSDALSSVAYATEEILLVLALIGTGAFAYSLPISLIILFLLLIITISYRQIIFTFPSGGGAYLVAKEHLNINYSLIAGAALMIDYILTVAVSVTSGVAAITSAFPFFIPWKVLLSVLLVVILMVLNLRGIRESATVFAYPTYLFIGSVLLMILFGGYQLWHDGWHGYPQTAIHHGNSLIGSGAILLLFLRAFASGCSAMTGVEAISNGVPAFRSPSAKNAAKTMIWMSVILATMFFGITILAYGYGITPKEHETVVSQIVEHIFGRGILYYFIQIVTMLILFLAANTSFAGFPQLTSIIAKDGFLPRNLTARGDRLVFSNGIILLSVLAIILIIAFHGDSHALIPLYAVGVFLSFTIAQAGMVKSFIQEKGNKWLSRTMVNGIGTLFTGIVTIVTIVAKFTEGAWMVTLAIPIVVLIFYRIKDHYNDVSNELRLEQPIQISEMTSKVIIPISGVSKVVAQSVSYAKSISDDVVAVTVAFDDEQASRMREKWNSRIPNVPLVILRSPYRTLIPPLMKYIDNLEKSSENMFITILIPQFIVRKWWHTLLHNQTAVVLRTVLLHKKNVVVATIPFHLRH
ncbi:APC family permease [Tepidibacillus sp. LV47]|uniref:APC family permease n=1 Tax=Tepidibacillus sp. LV47 TaxID=3398228 RepID=UPI003AAF68DF